MSGRPPLPAVEPQTVPPRTVPPRTVEPQTVPPRTVEPQAVEPQTGLLPSVGARPAAGPPPAPDAVPMSGPGPAVPGPAVQRVSPPPVPPAAASAGGPAAAGAPTSDAARAPAPADAAVPLPEGLRPAPPAPRFPGAGQPALPGDLGTPWRVDGSPSSWGTAEPAAPWAAAEPVTSGWGLERTPGTSDAGWLADRPSTGSTAWTGAAAWAGTSGARDFGTAVGTVVAAPETTATPLTQHPSAPLPTGPFPRPGRPVAPLPPIPGLQDPDDDLDGLRIEDADLGDDPETEAPRLRGAAGRAQAAQRRRERRAAMSPVRRVGARVLAVLLTLVVVLAGYYVGLYVHTDRLMDRVDALSAAGPEVLAPLLQAGTTNYVVVGTGAPGVEGPASVSTLLAHVAPEGERAVLVSFPPTALVDTPQCRAADGSLRPPTTEAFADGLLRGGPSCLVRSVQQLTGVRVDHYLAVDLQELPGMVDALGGITVCLDAPVDAAAAGQALPAGESSLNGEEAGRYLTPGTAGDDPAGAAAAEREQLLLTATLRRALTTSTLADPLTLTRFLTRAGTAFTVDEGTSLADVRTLGSTLGDLEGSAVQRTTAPVRQAGYVPPAGADVLPAAGDPAATPASYVLLDTTAMRQLFDAVIERSELPPALTAPVADPAPVPADGGSGGEAATAGTTVADPAVAAGVAPDVTTGPVCS